MILLIQFKTQASGAKRLGGELTKGQNVHKWLLLSITVVHIVTPI